MLDLRQEPIKLEKLIIPDVTDRETVDELKSSLSTTGLLHAITVTEGYRIYAGRRRAQAAKELGWSYISCVILPKDITPQQLEEVEIDENLRRRNLPWYDAVILRKKLFDLRVQQKGPAKQGKKVGFSLRDLASELQEGLGTLSQDLRLAEAVMADPSLRNIEDKVTAQRLIFNKSKRIEAEAEAMLPPKITENMVLCGDSASVLNQFPDNCFDVCFTDPPWLEYKDKSLVKDAFTLPVFKEVYRVLKHDSFMYVICSTPDFYTYLSELSQIGFKCQQYPLFWVKQNVISHGLRGWEYMRDYEPILLAVKGSPVLTMSTAPSAAYTSPAIHPALSIHPNEKPVDVPLYYLNHCSYEGSLILDPFGGSGVTAEACIKSGRRYVIIERQKEYADGIERRLAGVLADQNKATKSAGD
jgi:site-specific DNA-methyltransferase (adenine-specific)